MGIVEELEAKTGKKLPRGRKDIASELAAKRKAHVDAMPRIPTVADAIGLALRKTYSGTAAGELVLGHMLFPELTRTVIEQELTRPPTEFGSQEEGARAVARGVVGIPKAAVGAAQVGLGIAEQFVGTAEAVQATISTKLGQSAITKREPLANLIREISAFIDPARQALSDVQRGPQLQPSVQAQEQGGLPNIGNSVGETLDNFRAWTISHGGELAPQLAAQTGAAVATGGSSTAFAVVGGVMAAGETFDEAVQDRIAKGEDPDDARVAASNEAAVVGVLTTALEKVGGKYFLGKTAPKFAPTVRQAVKEAAKARGKSAGAEGLTEFLQTGAEAVAEQISRQTNRPIGEILEDMFGAMALGVGTGSTLSPQVTFVAKPIAPTRAAFREAGLPGDMSRQQREAVADMVNDRQRALIEQTNPKAVTEFDRQRQRVRDAAEGEFKTPEEVAAAQREAKAQTREFRRGELSEEAQRQRRVTKSQQETLREVQDEQLMESVGAMRRGVTTSGEVVARQRAARRVIDDAKRMGQLPEKVTDPAPEATPEAPSEVQGMIETNDVKKSFFDDDGGAVSIDAIAQAVGTGIGRGSRFLRKHFTARGDLPQQIFNLAVAKDAAVHEHMTRFGFLTRDFNDAAKRAYGGRGKMTDADIQQLHDFLTQEQGQGVVPVSSLPQPMQGVMTQMRDQVDAFSQHMLNEGMIQGSMVGTFRKNLGMYLRRSYLVFDQPLFSEKFAAANPQVVNKIKGMIRQHLTVPPNVAAMDRTKLLATAKRFGVIGGNGPHPQPITAASMSSADLIAALQTVPLPTQKQIDQQFNELTDIGKKAAEEGGLLEAMNKGKLGGKDLSMLIHLKDIAPEIRALWGEIKDPLVAYGKTIEKMVKFIANHHFLTRARQWGLGKIFFDPNDPDIHPDAVREIAAPGGDSMSPLNGLKTFPEIEQAFREHIARRQDSGFWRFYHTVNTATKYGKTVLSPMTHVRNVTANHMFMLSQGHWRIGKMKDAFLATGTTFGLTEKALFGKDKASRDDYRAIYLDAQRHGIVADNANAGELQDQLRRSWLMSLDEWGASHARTAGEKVRKGADITFGTTTKLYRAEDDVFKVYAWANEIADYKKARPDLSEGEIKALTASIVRNTYPTYSMVPKLIQKLGRFPVVGTFVSFPWEVYRTQWHTLRQIQLELRDPRTRGIAGRRIAGTLAAHAEMWTVAAIGMMLAGVTFEEDEALRESEPPWNENQLLLHLGRDESGRWRKVNIGYQSVYGDQESALVALLRGEDWESKLTESSLEMLEPFVGEEILGGAILDIFRNKKKDSGSPVWNPADDPTDRFADMLGHVIDEAEPGLSTNVRELARGAKGDVNDWTGEAYNPTITALKNVTGVNMEVKDPLIALNFQSRDAASELSMSTSLLASVASQRGQVTDGELADAHADMERARRRFFDKMHTKYRAALILGYSDEQIKGIMRLHLNQETVDAMASGQYQPWKPTPQFLEAMSKQSAVLPGSPQSAGPDEFQRRRRLVQQLSIQAIDAPAARDQEVDRITLAWVKRLSTTTPDPQDVAEAKMWFRTQQLSDADLRAALLESFAKQPRVIVENGKKQLNTRWVGRDGRINAVRRLQTALSAP